VPDPAATTARDLIGRDFAITTAAPDRRWCGGITYIDTWQGWLYLATVIGLTSRRVVGGPRRIICAPICPSRPCRAVLNRRRPAPWVVFHSDRGCQCTSQHYRRVATEAGERFGGPQG
jgi:transposase InsO family protein